MCVHSPGLLSRREFCHWSLLAPSAGLAALGANRPACSAPSDFAQPAKTYPPGRYVDVHTHLGQTWNSTEVLSAEKLLSWMDENDVAQAIVLPLDVAAKVFRNNARRVLKL